MNEQFSSRAVDELAEIYTKIATIHAESETVRWEYSMELNLIKIDLLYLIQMARYGKSDVGRIGRPKMKRVYKQTISYNGEMYTITDFCRLLGISRPTYYKYVDYGYSIEEIAKKFDKKVKE